MPEPFDSMREMARQAAKENRDKEIREVERPVLDMLRDRAKTFHKRSENWKRKALTVESLIDLLESHKEDVAGYQRVIVELAQVERDLESIDSDGQG